MDRNPAEFEPSTVTMCEGDKKRRLTALAKWLSVLVIFFFIGRFLIDNWTRLNGVTLVMQPLFLLASLLLLCLNFFFSAVLWQRLTELNRTAIGFRDGISAWFYSLLGKYVPGKVMLWAGRVYYYRRAGHGIKKVTFCFTLEFSLQLLAAVLIIALVAPAAMPTALSRYQLAAGLVLAAGIVLGLNPTTLERGLNRVLRLLRRPEVRIAMGRWDMLLLLAGYLANAFLLGLAFFLFVRGVYPIGVDHLLFLTASFLFAGWIGILSLFAPGGLGVREGVLLLALKLVLPAAVAAVIVLAARLWTTAGELICVAIIYALNRLRPTLPGVAADLPAGDER